jgi:hypothetical protein
MGEPFKLRLPTADDLAHILAHFGKGACMWSLDLSRCYRQWRADPLDWPLLGITWAGCYYIDTAIAFGLRHGAAFAQRVSTAVCDILARESHTALSYIDDFLGTEASAAKADLAYNRAIELTSELGLQIAASKSVPPATTVTWIGVRFDSLAMEMSIPPTVLADTTELVNTWARRDRASRHDLQVLLGRLFHSAKCSAPARLFVGRMLHTLREAPSQGTTPLTVGFRKDLAWFAEFLPTYNGVKFITPSRPVAHLCIHTTSTTIRAVWEQCMVEGTLPDFLRVRSRLLASKELYTVYIALLLWGECWAGHELHIYTTAASRVEILVHGKSRDLGVLHVARGIWLCTARQDIVLKPKSLINTSVRVGNFEKWAVPAAAIEFLHDF